MTGNPARKWWALVAIAASVLVVGLDLTVLNLALPVLSTQLHASTRDLQWFSASYSLVLAAAMLPAGLLGDRLGRKKMLLIALVVFGASSAACAYARPRRADRGPRGARHRRRGDLPDVDRGDARAVRPGGAAAAIALMASATFIASRSARCWAAGCWTTSGGARSS